MWVDVTAYVSGFSESDTSCRPGVASTQGGRCIQGNIAVGVMASPAGSCREVVSVLRSRFHRRKGGPCLPNAGRLLGAGRLEDAHREPNLPVRCRRTLRTTPGDDVGVKRLVAAHDYVLTQRPDGSGSAWHRVRLMTSVELKVLARRRHDLIAGQTCPAPAFSRGLCRKCAFLERCVPPHC